MMTTFVYLIYIVVLAISGFRWPGGMSAPYNFMNFSVPTGWWGFDLSQMSSTTLGIGVGYLIIALSLIFGILGLIMIAIKKKINQH